MKRALTLASLSLLISSVAMPIYAQDKPILTVYTYDAFAADWGPGPQLKAGFEASCDCTLDIIAVDSSIGALRRAQIEGDTTKADIILGLDTSIVGEARSTGLFADHSVDTSALSVPNDWSSADFVPFDYGYFAMVYRTADFPEPPKNFEQLVLGNSETKIVIQDPRSSTPGLGLVLWLKAAYKDDTEEAWPDIAKNVVTVTPDWSSAYGLFLDGEADMVLSYTTSPAYHRIAEEDMSYAAAIFDEGHYMQIEVAGVLKSSQQQELANEFLQYLISEAAQNIIPTTNWMYPVLDIELPEGFDKEPKKVLLLPEADVAANTQAWTQEMLAAFN